MAVDSFGLPEAGSLRLLEKQSRQDGSGLCRDGLTGDWRLERIWTKGRSHPSEAASGALRALAARLGIHPADDGGLLLSNSIALGLLKLCFVGSAELRGRRPLLVFQFQTMQLSLAGRTVWTLSLPKPDKRQEPFFALIASERTSAGKHWLAARGRGGGLALWVREEDGSP
jgi:hypothetical protein